MLSGIGSELAQSPILTLFVVIGLGYLLGELNLFSFRLRVVGVLFMGIAVGALNPNIHIPEAVASLGLILFVYTLGIQSGPVGTNDGYNFADTVRTSGLPTADRRSGDYPSGARDRAGSWL
jgi:uncharacterized transporter YbjL